MNTIILHINKIVAQPIYARVKPTNLNSLKMLEKMPIQQKLISKFNQEKVLKYVLAK